MSDWQYITVRGRDITFSQLIEEARKIPKGDCEALVSETRAAYNVEPVYNAKIIDPDDPLYFGWIGRIKEEIGDPPLYFIRFPGGEGALYFRDEFEFVDEAGKALG